MKKIILIFTFLVAFISYAFTQVIDLSPEQTRYDLKVLGGKVLTYTDKYGVDVDQSLRTVTATGQTDFKIHDNIKRCMLLDNGTVNYYLDGYNKVGVSPSVSGTAESASAILKLKDVGMFASGVVVGQYIKNITTDKYHKILAVDDNDEVSLLFDLPSTDDNWGATTATTIDTLEDSGADFTAAGVIVGDLVFNRTDNTFASITDVGTTKLEIDADIFVSGESYSIIKDCFTVGDTYEVHTAIFADDNGQVMVEIPKFYYKYSVSGDITSHDISENNYPGYFVHPAFTPGGVEKDYIYVGAFENTRIGYWQGINAYLSTNDGGYVVGSQAGLQPISRGRRYIARICAGPNRAAGWHLLDMHTVNAIQLLFLIEYAAFDAQSEIGSGFTDWNVNESEAIAYNNRYGAIHTGWSLKDGNGTASLSKGDRFIGSYMSYRGMENLYGSLNCMIDGINIMSDSKVYLCNTPASYADATTTGCYEDIGITLLVLNNNIDTYQNYAYLFVPGTVTGPAALIPNQYKHSTGAERVLIVSGTSGYSSKAGMFTWSSTTPVNDRAEHNAFRVVYR